MNTLTANYDESGKEALNEYFEAFLDFLFPQVYHLIDWGKIPQSLDKELQQITASSETDKCIVDKKAHDDMKMVLQVRLGEIPSDIEDSLNQVSDLSILDEMLKSAATVNSLEEFILRTP